MSKGNLGKNKYGARECWCDGERFDSRKEMRRWKELRLLEKAGEITGLQRQVRFEIIPEQRAPDTVVNGRRRQGKLLERKTVYVADFVYKKAGETVVEDVKGMKTEVYRLKRKMMLWVYGIRINEV